MHNGQAALSAALASNGFGDALRHPGAWGQSGLRVSAGGEGTASAVGLARCCRCAMFGVGQPADMPLTEAMQLQYGCIRSDGLGVVGDATAY